MRLNIRTSNKEEPNNTTESPSQQGGGYRHCGKSILLFCVFVVQVWVLWEFQKKVSPTVFETTAFDTALPELPVDGTGGGGGDGNITTTTTTSTSTTTHDFRQRCIERRGTSGYWYRDEDFSRKNFYAFGYRSEKWARQHDILTTAYPGNAYNWRDTSMMTTTTMDDETETSSCQISAVNHTFFCDTLTQLGVQRMLMVGDSLMGEQRLSLLNLIRHQPLYGGRKQNNDYEHDCGNNHTIHIDFRRENMGANFRFASLNLTGREDATDQQQFGPETPYCGSQGQTSMEPDEYCPWQLDYKNNESDDNKKTVLVLNQGAHFHSEESFRNSFDHFIEKFNTIARPHDIVIFRNTAPGHFDCWDEVSPPSVSIVNLTHDLFLERYATNNYDWHLFDKYNHYAKEKMATALNPSVTSLYLNIYNMTVLRPDEHVRSTDCLHYMHPGPQDFWNHLLLSNLADLATLQQQDKQDKE